MRKPIRQDGLWKVNIEQLKKWLPNAYYYLFYGALGSLFPFINLYYRSIGLNPWQVGILAGVRPFVALLSGPFWCYVSNRYKARKFILMTSLVCWVAFTLPIAFVNYAHYSNSCSSRMDKFFNTTSKSKENYTKSGKREFITNDKSSDLHDFLRKIQVSRKGEDNTLGVAKTFSSGRFIENNGESRYGRSSERSNLDKRRIKRESHSNNVMSLSLRNLPRFVGIGKPFLNSFSLSGMTLRKKPLTESRKPYNFKSRGSPYVNKRLNPYAITIFIEIFFFVLVGQIFQTPTDVLNIHYEGTFMESLSVLQYQTVPAKNRLYSSLGFGIIALLTGTLLNVAPNYVICDNTYSDYRISFFIFATLITSALLVSSTFSFKYQKKKTRFEVLRCFKELSVSHHFPFVGITILMGIFRGVLQNFLYWTVIEIDATEVVVGITVMCQYLSDSVMAMSAPILMKYIGYIGMIFIGLASYAMRFIIFSWLSSPNSAWVVPSVELLQGVSHSTAWSAFILYVTNYTPRSTYPVGIFLVQGLYLGVGSSIGAMISGGMIEVLNTNVTFKIFGLMSLFSCIVFTMMQPTGMDEILPDDVEPMSYLSEEECSSLSVSEEELLFDCKKQNVIYTSPKDRAEENNLLLRDKVILSSTNAPLVPTIMAIVHPQREKEPIH